MFAGPDFERWQREDLEINQQSEETQTETDGESRSSNSTAGRRAAPHETRKARRNRLKKLKRKQGLTDDASNKRRLHLINRSGSGIDASTLEVQGLPHSEPAYEGLREGGRAFAFLNGTAKDRLEKLLSIGYELVRDDIERCALPSLGKAALTEYPRSSDHPLVSKDDRVFGVIVTWPVGWEKRQVAITTAFHQLNAALEGVSFAEDHRRGDFTQLSTGMSHGNGRKVRVVADRLGLLADPGSAP